MNKLIKYLTVLLILTSKSYSIDINKKLDDLFLELKNNNYQLALRAEQEIWTLWSTHPTNDKLTARLEEGSQLVRDQNYLKAKDIFTEVINLDQSWAEAWNKRATVLYMLGEFQKSQEDINRVLALEERHFGALAGQGLVNIQLRNYEKAIYSYEEAKKIYPSMKSAEIMISRIKKLIKDDSI